MRLCWLLALVGCKQIFGLDNPALEDTASPTTVTGSLALIWVENDVETPIRKERAFTRDEVTLSVRLDDGTESAVAMNGGSFSFTTNGHPYALRIVSPFSDRTLMLDQTNLDLVERILGHIERTPPSQPLTITLQLTNRPSGAVLETLHTTGLWATGDIPSTGVLDWNQLLSQSGPLGVLEASKLDAMFYNGHVTTNGFEQLRYVASSGVVGITDGGTYPFTIAPLLANRCARLDLKLASELARLRAYTPANFTTEQFDWVVYATPTTEFAPMVVTHPLAYLINSSTSVDGTLDIAYGNPYRMPVYVVGKAYFLRTVNGAILDASTATFAPVNELTCTTPISLPGDAIAIPTHIRIEGVELVIDDTPIALATANPTVSWDLSPGKAELFSVFVRELVGGSLVVRKVISTTTSEVAIDRAVFVPDHTYNIVVVARLGLPGIATGDFRSQQATFARSVANSATFRIH
jgi:hypothetical protein